MRSFFGALVTVLRAAHEQGSKDRSEAEGPERSQAVFPDGDITRKLCTGGERIQATVKSAGGME